jgi:hypothetical protein
MLPAFFQRGLTKSDSGTVERSIIANGTMSWYRLNAATLIYSAIITDAVHETEHMDLLAAMVNAMDGEMRRKK